MIDAGVVMAGGIKSPAFHFLASHMTLLKVN
jgi:hypothetical protein